MIYQASDSLHSVKSLERFIMSSGRVETDAFVATRFRKTGLATALFLGACVVAGWVSSPEDEAEAATLLLHHPVFRIVVCFFSLLLLVSAARKSLYWLQPVILLLLVPIPMFAHISSMFSLCFFICAVLLLDTLAFFSKRPILRLSLLVCYYCLCEIVIGILFDAEWVVVALSILAAIAVVVFLSTFMDDLSIQKAIKPSLSLAQLGVSKTEGEYLRALMHGMSIKEIAAESGVTESTVRNTLARVYRKFEVHDKAMLLAKCEKYTIVD